MTHHAIIMAGGEGTRLRPFTRSIPKPLLPIGRKPVAQIIVERLRDCGICNITMTLEYGADLIRAYFQDGKQFGVNIDYYHEPRKMGTAGCLKHVPAVTQLPAQAAFLVTNGDILTDLDYAALMATHTVSGAMMTVATRRGEVAIPYGVVQHTNGVVQSIEEKPTLHYTFNAGVYALSAQAVDLIPEQMEPPGFPMTDLIARVISAGHKVHCHAFDGLWFDLARVDDFEKALEELERVNPALLE